MLRERVPNMYWKRDWLGCRTVKDTVVNWENIHVAEIAPPPSSLWLMILYLMILQW
jgi:hypothetical protein